jgi:hypothetical protein
VGGDETYLMPFSFAQSNSAEVRPSLDEVVVPPPTSADAVPADRDVGIPVGGQWDDASAGDDGTMTNAAESHDRRQHWADSIIGSTRFRRDVALLVEDGPMVMGYGLLTSTPSYHKVRSWAF